MVKLFPQWHIGHLPSARQPVFRNLRGPNALEAPSLWETELGFIHGAGSGLVLAEA